MRQPTVITPLDLANQLGIESPTAKQEDRIYEEILNAQADVEDYLNRSLFTYTVSRTNEWKDYRFPPDNFRAWPWATDEYDDDIAVTASTENPDGTWNVTLKVGFDGANTNGVVRYVKAHVREVLRNDPDFTAIARRISSVSAEGQSISYDKGSVAEGAAGASATLDSLRRHRRHSAHRAQSRTFV
jgi:hypothetical protein